MWYAKNVDLSIGAKKICPSTVLPIHDPWPQSFQKRLACSKIKQFQGFSEWMPGSSSMAQRSPTFHGLFGKLFKFDKPNLTHVKFHGDMVLSVSFDFFLGWKKSITQPITHHPKPEVPRHPNPPWWPSPQTPRCHRNPDWPWVSRIFRWEYHPRNRTAGYPKMAIF